MNDTSDVSTKPTGLVFLSSPRERTRPSAPSLVLARLRRSRTGVLVMEVFTLVQPSSVTALLSQQQVIRSESDPQQTVTVLDRDHSPAARQRDGSPSPASRQHAGEIHIPAAAPRSARLPTARLEGVLPTVPARWITVDLLIVPEIVTATTAPDTAGRPGPRTPAGSRTERMSPVSVVRMPIYRVDTSDYTYDADRSRQHELTLGADTTVRSEPRSRSPLGRT